MSKLKSKKWWDDAGIRAIKTVAQTAVALIPAGVTITDVGWLVVIGSSALAGVCSILTSIATIKVPDQE